MCGIAGIISQHPLHKQDQDALKEMTRLLKHRGPDDEGFFFHQNCILGHRRLSIIDLSKDGHQPFVSDDNRYQLVFNGEIYNYIELRETLKKEGVRFRTKTDTEVLLKAYLRWGADCLHAFNGMFAFAVYDAQERILFMARDRFGVKPLYYLAHNDKLCFASELKALLSINGIPKEINEQALFDYFIFSRTDIHEETFLRNVKRLPKGHKAVFKDGELKVSRWWDPGHYLNKHISDSMEVCARTVRELLIDSVKLRLRSDVPVGSCLSGGLDSTILTGILFEECAAKEGYPTFTASFAPHRIDETKYIDALNKRLPFSNHRAYPKASAAYERLKEFVYTNDEPTTNATFFSQFEVMELARKQGVTVLLDGQGGDEDFTGYHYFHGFLGYGLWKRKKWGAFLSQLLATLMRGQDILGYQTFGFLLLNDSLRKKVLRKKFPHVQQDFFNRHAGQSVIYNEFFDVDGLNTAQLRHFQYKLEHLLRSEDRNSMRFSIEARVPYLDYRLVEYVLGIREEFKIRNGETKYIQKEALGRYTIPQILNRRDKLGFATPADEWMRMGFWRELTQANYTKVQKRFPHIFSQAQAPRDATEAWKINQLAVWLEVFQL
ncbi:MAG TPA: asparagine synthase (glutamine-hydrolyzing) [Candidatus Omnitrophota bacterium]|nr:asparagine synthase (glutamine-hydrolyzing) [Candidatus Omnitrophota bacterium]